VFPFHVIYKTLQISYSNLSKILFIKVSFKQVP
jgi:hypothetical protein